MADTSIEWADKTWNPLLGCERVSGGCDGCYAITTATIRAGNPHPKVAAAFAGLTERRDGRLDWTGRINLLPDRLTQPLRWKKPRRIFVNSQSDLFHKDVPAEYIARVLAVIAATPQHTYQLLTKRHGRMRSFLTDECRCGAGHAPGVHLRSAIEWAATPHSPTYVPGIEPGLYHRMQWPLPNLHVGVSVEDQKTADLRIPALLNTPAAVRWLSCEPLLGPVDLHAHDDGRNHWLPDFGPEYDDGSEEPVCQAHGLSRCWQGCAYIDWVVVGGETGAKSRPMRLPWARTLRDQCVAAGVPFFFKQWGDWVPVSQMSEDTFMDWDAANGGDQVDRDVPWRMGKKRAGRLLDEREWNEYPTQRTGAVA